MRRRFPDNRARYVRECINTGRTPENPVEKMYFTYLRTGKNVPDANLAYALEIQENAYESQILNALFLAGITDEQLEYHVGIKAGPAAVYKQLFFDVSQFRDDLDIYSWVRELEAARSHNMAVELFRQAIIGGLDALLWVYSRQKQRLEPKEVLQSILADSFFRAKMGRGSPINSMMAKASHTYMATALKAGELLVKHNEASQAQTKTGIDELLIRLKTRELTASVEDANIIEADLLH